MLLILTELNNDTGYGMTANVFSTDQTDSMVLSL